MDRYSILLGKTPPVEIAPPTTPSRYLVIGPRRSGKTTYLCQQVDGYIKQNQTVTFVCSPEMHKSWKTKPVRYIRNTTATIFLRGCKSDVLIFDDLQFLGAAELSETIEWPEETSAALFPKKLRIFLYKINRFALSSSIMASYSIDETNHLPDALNIAGINWSVIKLHSRI